MCLQAPRIRDLAEALNCEISEKIAKLPEIRMGHIQGTRNQDLRLLSTALAAGRWEQCIQGPPPGILYPAQPAVLSEVESGACHQAPAHRGWALPPCTRTPGGTRMEDWVPPAPRRHGETFVGRRGAGHDPQRSMGCERSPCVWLCVGCLPGIII